MDGAKNLMEVWSLVIVSQCYCFIIGKLVPKGIKRLILVIPVVFTFLLVPLRISSVHFGGTTAFFVAWLSNFKLLLFAFGRGPLSSNTKPLSLPLFLVVSCFPIKILLGPKPPKCHPNGGSPTEPPAEIGLHGRNKQNPPPKSRLYGRNGQKPSRRSHLHSKIDAEPNSGTWPDGHQSRNFTTKSNSRQGPLNYSVKTVALVLLIKVYDYRERMPQKAVLALYAIHIYFMLELILVAVAAVVRATLGLELEPQFNEPYLATSLQDFWGRRWNLMVTSILRPTVYEPALRLFSPVFGKMGAPLPAVLCTFVVSALMHELIFYYMGRLRPAWEVTWFFLIHGFCTAVEIAVKKAIGGRWRLPTAVGRFLTAGFVIATAVWLFLPELERCKIANKAFEEYAAVGAFVELIAERVGGFLPLPPRFGA